MAVLIHTNTEREANQLSGEWERGRANGKNAMQSNNAAHQENILS